MLSYHCVKYLEIESIIPHTDLVLLETLGFVLMVGTIILGKFFPRKTIKGLKMGCFPPFLVIFCLHAKCPSIFLSLATVAASVITDFEILNMCTFKKDKHYF
jgi:hypothetical protein